MSPALTRYRALVIGSLDFKSRFDSVQKIVAQNGKLDRGAASRHTTAPQPQPAALGLHYK